VKNKIVRRMWMVLSGGECVDYYREESANNSFERRVGKFYWETSVKKNIGRQVGRILS